MDDTSAWARKPRRVLRPVSAQPRSMNVRYTWAGPIDPQLYSDTLNHLSKNTERNLARLERVRHRPHSAQPLLRHLASGQNDFYGWQDRSVMFAPRDIMDKPVPADDDASTVSTMTGPTNFCYLCSSMEEHQQHLMRMRVPKKPREPKKPRVRYVAPPPRVRVKIDEPHEVMDHRYKVVVWTGTDPESTTDANVYVTIQGDANVLDKTKLCHGSVNNKVVFCRGSKETFFIKSPYLGNLEILSIEHDGLGKRHAWYCEKVEVTCMKTHEHWVFVCQNWLSLHHGDYMTRRDLVANHLERKRLKFELKVYTGSKLMAGTDANVYVQFFGTEGNSKKIRLNPDPGQKCFQKGSVDTFKFVIDDIGEVNTMRIEHDGKGMADGWFLEKAILQDIDDPKKIYYFLWNGWLAKDQGDGHLWREIRAKKKLAKEVTTGKPVNYKVTVRTGDVKYAGTDANVHIVMQGKKGKTKKLKMDDSRDNFERGMTEVFELSAMNVGPITSVIIGHDNSGPGAGWYCEDITVRKYLTKEEQKEFLLALRKKKPRNSRRKQRTSDKIRERSLSAVEEEDEEESEDEEEENIREGSYKDVFDVNGKVVKVPIYEEYYFVCKNWLATDEGDGLLERELKAKDKRTFFAEK